MKKVLFVKTTPNHSGMHNRFKGKLKLEHNADFVSKDFSLLLDEYIIKFVYMFFVTRVISKKNMFRVLSRSRHLFIFFLNRYLKNKITDYLKGNKYSAVVLSDNYYSYIHSVVIFSCKSLNIKVLCVPYVNQDIEDILISFRYSSNVVKRSKGLLSKYIKRNYPEWMSYYKGDKFLWLHPLDIFSISMLGLNVSNPKAGVSELVDAVLVSHDLAKERFISYGARHENIFIIGDISFDYVDRLADKKYKMVLFSICPELKHPCVYKDYDLYIKHLLVMADKLNKKGFAVLFSAHPSVSNKVTEKIVCHGYTVDERDILTLLSLADVYIASHTSTIVYASLFGVPVFELDLYIMNRSGNKKLPNVKTIEQPETLELLVDGLDISSFGGNRESNCLYLECFDGKVIDRFLEFC